jgi:AcrR family transcriptional regulator
LCANKLIVKELLSKISIPVNESIYLKNPESSELGQRIVRHSVEMIHEMGFEQFTFRKLGTEIGSTEASIYRYFESKHKLLLYLTNWYWGWMEAQMVFVLANIESPTERLEKAIILLSSEVKEDSTYAQINEAKLHQVVITESSKSYLTSDVDKENSMGFFAAYKGLVARLSNIMLEINSNFSYPHMLASAIIEGIHQQRFFAQHLPGLTDVVKGEDAIHEFYKHLAFSVINTNPAKHS